MWGIVGTGSDRGFRIWTKTNIKTKPNQAKTKNITKTMVLVNFWATVTCWVSKGMHLSLRMQWWPQMSDFNISQTKTNINQNQKYSQNHGSDLFSPAVTCRVPKSMYSSWEIQCWPQIGNLNKSKVKPNQSKPKNIAKTMVLTNFWPTVTCLVSKSIYLTWDIQWWPQIFHMNQPRTKPHQTKQKQ